MRKLNDALYERIMALSEEGNELADDEKYAEAKDKFEEALGFVPAPKTDWESALWLYASIGDMCFMIGDYKACGNNMFDALNCPDGFGNPFVHLRLGQALYELGNTEKAKEYLLQAYMLDGEDIFDDQDEKYFDVIKSIV